MAAIATVRRMRERREHGHLTAAAFVFCGRLLAVCPSPRRWPAGGGAACASARLVARPGVAGAARDVPATGRFAARRQSRAERRRNFRRPREPAARAPRISFLASSIGMCATPATLIDPAVAVQTLLLGVAQLLERLGSLASNGGPATRVLNAGDSFVVFGMFVAGVASGETWGSRRRRLVIETAE